MMVSPTLVSFSDMLISILTGLVWDFLPVMLVMVFHHRNFKGVSRPIINANEEEEVCTMLDYASKSKSDNSTMGRHLSKSSLNDDADDLLSLK